MKKLLQQRKLSRRGAIAVLAAALMIPLLAMVAFCVDLGYVVRVSAELQNAADAAALAGASKLMMVQTTNNPFQDSLSSNCVTSAQSEAKRFSALNKGGGVSLNVPDNDVVVGYLSNPTDASQSISAWSAGGSFPNSVQVTVRRESVANGPVALFFGRVLNNSSWTGHATSTASYSAGAYNVTGFKSWTGGPNSLLLPIALDVNLWTTFMSTGASPDGAVHDNYSVVRPSSSVQPPNNISNGGDYIPEFTDVYPNNTSPGNFGLVDLGPPASDVPRFESWILYGPTPADLLYISNDGLQATPSNPGTLRGGPGLKSTLVSDLQAIVGKPRILPLFSAYSGQGSNTQYTIVGFVGATIVSASGSGSNLTVIAQPCIVIDPTVTSGGTSTSGSSGIFPTSPLRLTR